MPQFSKSLHLIPLCSNLGPTCLRKTYKLRKQAKVKSMLVLLNQFTTISNLMSRNQTQTVKSRKKRPLKKYRLRKNRKRKLGSRTPALWTFLCCKLCKHLNLKNKMTQQWYSLKAGRSGKKGVKKGWNSTLLSFLQIMWTSIECFTNEKLRQKSSQNYIIIF